MLQFLFVSLIDPKEASTLKVYSADESMSMDRVPTMKFCEVVHPPKQTLTEAEKIPTPYERALVRFSLHEKIAVGKKIAYDCQSVLY